VRLGFVNAAAWVDLNNDGYLDIALARQNTSGQGILQNVMVCLNAGEGDPGDLTVELPGLPNSTVPMRDVRAHDLDNNTIADLVFSPVGTGTEHFYMGYSTQSGPVWVEQAAALGVPANTGTGKSVMLADLNKDGDLDVFLGRSSGESVYLQNRPVVGTGEGPTNNFLRVALQNQSQVGGT
jgi:hypothetical protein